MPANPDNGKPARGSPPAARVAQSTEKVPKPTTPAPLPSARADTPSRLAPPETLRVVPGTAGGHDTDLGTAAPPKPQDEGLLNSCFRLLSRFGGIGEPTHVLVRSDARSRPVATFIAAGGQIYEAAGVGTPVEPARVFRRLFVGRDDAVLRMNPACRRADKACFRALLDERVLSSDELNTFMLKCLAHTVIEVVDVGEVKQAVLERIPLSDDLAGFARVKPLDIMIHIIEALKQGR